MKQLVLDLDVLFSHALSLAYTCYSLIKPVGDGHSHDIWKLYLVLQMVNLKPICRMKKAGKSDNACHPDECGPALLFLK